MTGTTGFAALPDAAGFVVKALAVVGGAVLGGLFVGLFAQLLVRAFTGKTLPPFARWLLRVLGGVLVGWIIALFVFGGGGPGLGGLGGWGFGSGSGGGDSKDSETKKDATPKDSTPTKDAGSGTAPKRVLRVEVLTDPTVAKALGKEGVERQRYYRVEGTAANDLLTLDALKEKIRERLKKQPPLERLDVVTREDSPDKDVPRVAELRHWAEDQKIKVEFPPRRNERERPEGPDDMADAATPTAPTAPSDGLRIVLFGMPAAGKSSLLGALAQAAQSQEHLLNGHLTDVSHGLDELRHRLYDENGRRTAEEVVPYPIDFEPFSGDGRDAAANEHVAATVVDCDGRVANDLLVRHQALDDRSPEGTLAHEVVEADTLVLVVDAAAPPAQVEADFAEFDRFLRQMERRRGQETEVGGLPVFLVLSKCDLLARPGDTPAAWMERIEERKREVDARFRDFLARREREAGPLPFGRIDLHLWATAVKRPELVGSPAKAREPYGVAELFRQCLEQATAFRDRRRQAGRRLYWTVGASAGIVALLLALTVALGLTNRAPKAGELVARVEDYRATDRATAVERLHGQPESLALRMAKLREYMADPGFDSLPDKDKQYVREREAELREYLEYYQKLRQARRPGDVRSSRELQDAKRLFQTELALPHAEWAETDAGRLHRARLDEADALEKAVERARNWYLDGKEEAERLRTFAGYQAGPDSSAINWRAWYADAEKLLDPAHKPPFAENEPIAPGSSITYAAALGFDRVAQAKAEWEEAKPRLEQVRNVAAALGLAGPVKDRPAVLDVPKGVTLEQARDRLKEMQKTYPNYKTEFTLADLPDAMKPEVRQAARTSYDFLIEPARAEVLRQLRQTGSGKETPARWAAVRDWLKDPPELEAWRVLALTLARLQSLDAVDPVTALAAFLQKTSFPIQIRSLTLELPDDLKVRLPDSAKFELYHPAGAGDKPALVLQNTGEGRRDAARRVWTYTFRPEDSQTVTYKPGDELWATLAVGDGRVFTWALSRSLVYQFESLLRPPRLHKADEPNTRGVLAEGVRLSIVPENGVPRVPDLLPVVRLNP